jgi:hypothetical protein
VPGLDGDQLALKINSMKKIILFPIRVWPLAVMAVLILLGVCFAQSSTDAAQSDPQIPQIAVSNPVGVSAIVAILVPMLIAGIKPRVPKPLRKWLPLLAPVLGEILMQLISGLFAALPNGLGAVAGSAGVGLREAKAQHFPKAEDTNPSGKGGGFNSGAALSSFFLVFALLGAVVIPFSGCARTLATGGVYQGDKVLFEADRAIDGAYETLHAFVTWEYENRAALSAYPEIGEAAKEVRLHAREWIDDAMALRDAYATNPTGVNRTKLQRAISVLRKGLAIAARHQSKSKQLN